MKQYLQLVRKVLENGERRANRTGVDTLSVFGAQTRFDLRDGFPLLTTKKVLFSAVVCELLWFLSGSTNINDGLTQHTPIWDAWADDDGELGPVYGFQWRRWGETPDEPGIDQLRNAVELIKTNPASRRIIINAWNVPDVPKMGLPPCHLLFQFNATPSGFLDIQLYQRSADLALGVPFNIASYALLLEIVARECGYVPRHFVHTFGDLHIYENHVAGLRRQLNRDPLPLPRLLLPDTAGIDNLQFSDVKLENYEHHPFIRFKVAV